MDHYEGDNIGSLASVQILQHFKFTGFDPVQLPPGVSWIEIPIKDESGKMNLKTEPSDNGRIYTYFGRFYMQQMRDEVDQFMDPFMDDVAILRLTDMNGRVYIIGAPGSPVTISENADTGQRYINENGTEFTFTISQAKRAISA